MHSRGRIRLAVYPHPNRAFRTVVWTGPRALEGLRGGTCCREVRFGSQGAGSGVVAAIDPFFALSSLLHLTKFCLENSQSLIEVFKLALVVASSAAEIVHSMNHAGLGGKGHL